ncbi:unnamed protein product, partial [Allacma fusca]
LRREAHEVILALEPSPVLIDEANHSSSEVTTNELQDEVIQLPQYSTEEISSLLADKDKEINKLRQELQIQKSRMYKLKKSTSVSSNIRAEMVELGDGLTASKDVVDNIRDRF